MCTPTRVIEIAEDRCIIIIIIIIIVHYYQQQNRTSKFTSLFCFIFNLAAGFSMMEITVSTSRLSSVLNRRRRIFRNEDYRLGKPSMPSCVANSAPRPCLYDHRFSAVVVPFTFSTLRTYQRTDRTTWRTVRASPGVDLSRGHFQLFGVVFSAVSFYYD